MKKSANPLASLSYLRIFATVSVIWLHTCSTLTANLELFDLSRSQMNFFNAAYQMMDWAVPVFLMITGVLMLDPERQISIRQCIKYLTRILLALVLFGIPFAMLKLVGESHVLRFSQIPLAIKAVLENSGFAHLWYLYVLAGIYLVLPLLKKLISHGQDSEILFLIAALFVFDFCFPLLSEILQIRIALELPLTYPLFYVLAGYFINKKKTYFAARKWLLLFLATACIALIWLLNYFVPDARVWTEYTSPLTAICGISVFGLFITHEFRNSDRLWETDRLCFGVYLIHPVFIQAVYRLASVSPVDFKAYPLAALFFFLGFTGCAFAASWIMSKIKPLKKYVL